MHIICSYITFKIISGLDPTYERHRQGFKTLTGIVKELEDAQEEDAGRAEEEAAGLDVGRRELAPKIHEKYTKNTQEDVKLS